MADATVRVSRDFFKNISIEIQWLRLILQSQGNFIDWARSRATKYGDIELLSDLDVIENCHADSLACSARLEKMAERGHGEPLE